jgi:hypothetical protein
MSATDVPAPRASSVNVVGSRYVPIGGASAVYFRGQAEQVPDDELERCAALYAARYPELRAFTADELHDDIRLYRARPTAHWVLVTGGNPQYGTGIDSRRPVWVG